MCNICKQARKKYKDAEQNLITISTNNACATIKTAAKVKDALMYTQIHNIDLIAREFKYHGTCYKNFTSGYSQRSLSASPPAPGTSSYEQPDTEKGTETVSMTNFDEVVAYINESVIDLQQAVSMHAGVAGYIRWEI